MKPFNLENDKRGTVYIYWWTIVDGHIKLEVRKSNKGENR